MIEVNNKIMYHLHKKGIHDDVWKVGNEIIVDDNFNSDFLDILDDFDTAVNTTDGDRVSFDEIITNYINEKALKKQYEKLLKDCIIIIKDTNIFKREMALEQVREAKYNHLPSRKHSVWLIDENNIKYWYDKLVNENNVLELYEVKITGNIFKSNNDLIPDDDICYKDVIKKAEDYWNADLNKRDLNKNEYLFQGKLKINKKLKYPI